MPLVILVIVGTRPESIKVLPILRELVCRKVAFQVLHTGQHTDLLYGTGLKVCQSLHLPGTNDPETYAKGVETALGALHDLKRPSWVVVQGDTASAVGGARWAVQQGYPLCHVEAGLRSHDLNDPWPEEGFRIEIDRLATLCCCPTEGNQNNLYNEWERDNIPGDFKLTGNTIVDALKAMNVKREPGNHVLVTLHRREAFGEPLKAILAGLAAVATQYPDTPFLWPVHPNPHVHEAIASTELPVNVMTRDPLPYRDFLTVLASAKAVLTDSGGVVEEAVTLGVPTLCCRDHTERPEAFNDHIAWLVGKTAEGVVAGFERIAQIVPPHGDYNAFASEEARQEGRRGFAFDTRFGDGRAAERIVDLIT